MRINETKIYDLIISIMRKDNNTTADAFIYIFLAKKSGIFFNSKP